MSNLNEQQFRLFHGTNKNIRGGFVNPTKQRGDEWEGDGPEAAFASNRPDVASEYGTHVYEVKPTGHEEYHGYNVYASDSGFAVKRKLKPEVVERYNRIITPIHEANEKAQEKRNRANTSGWQSWPGPAGSHVRYDEKGEEHATVLRPGQLHPGDSAPIHDNYYHQNYQKKTIAHLKWNDKATNWTHVKDLTPEQYLKIKKKPNDWHHSLAHENATKWQQEGKA